MFSGNKIFKLKAKNRNTFEKSLKSLEIKKKMLLNKPQVRDHIPWEIFKHFELDKNTAC